MLQQSLRRGDIQNFGEEGEPYMGGISILRGGLDNPLETMPYLIASYK